jgi:hypothetical protein
MKGDLVLRRNSDEITGRTKWRLVFGKSRVVFLFFETISSLGVHTTPYGIGTRMWGKGVILEVHLLPQSSAWGREHVY